MKIAVTYKNGMIFDHFGRTENFKLFVVEDNKIIESYVATTGGIAHEGIIALLKRWNVDYVICGGIGSGAANFLADAGINLCSNVSGDCDEAVNKFLNGNLVFSTKATHECSHNH